MPSYSPEQIKPVTDERLVDQLSLPAKIALLKKQPNAPQGDEKLDFKTAVYLCASLNNFTFEDALTSNNITILSILMSSFYKKLKEDGEQLKTMADYVDTLQELIDDGALEHLGPGLGFICPEFKIIAEGRIGARFMEHQYGTEQTFFNGSFNTLVFSRNIVLPGDEVTVAINGLTKMATVLQINKVRNMLIMTPSYSDPKKLFVQERGFEHTTFSFIGRKPHVERGNLYIVEIVQRKSLVNLAVQVREVVKDMGSLNGYIVRATLEHNLPSAWPQVITENLDKIPTEVKEDDIKGRVDLRDLPLVTIDGEDAKDFDDAVYCEKVGSKFHLYVAIADVSYYVRKDTALDQEAVLRCNSVYFPYFVIPMLPEALSNGICSLNPQVDRLCMVCDMMVDKHGEIESYKFYPAVMNSHARLTYTEAYGMIETGEASDPAKQCCVPWVKTLYELYQALKSARDKRGAFEFEGTEVSFVFDEHWNVMGLSPENRNEAHMLIEECMIAANVCAATFVKEHQYETLYRVHPRPTKEKLNNLRAILSKYGIDLRGLDEPSPEDFREVSVQVSKLAEGVRNVIGLQLLRSMSKASYNPTNIGHFGLALENYAHFTSPIRRYPDLQLHRVIKFILEKQEPRDWGNIGARAYTKEELIGLGVATTEREIESDNAEFDVDNSLKCEFVKQFVNFVVPATVSAINDYGVFVTLNDFFIDGRLVVVHDYSAQEQSFTFYGGWLDKNKFGIGDQITVRIMSVYPDTRKIELEIAPPDSKKKAEQVMAKYAAMYPTSAIKDSVESSNRSREKLFGRVSDISRGRVPLPEDIVQRPITDFGLEEQMVPRCHAPSGNAKKRAAFKKQLSEIKEQLGQSGSNGVGDPFAALPQHECVDPNNLDPTKVNDYIISRVDQTVAHAAEGVNIAPQDIANRGRPMVVTEKAEQDRQQAQARAEEIKQELSQTQSQLESQSNVAQEPTQEATSEEVVVDSGVEVALDQSAQEAVKEGTAAVAPTLIKVKRKGKVTNETILNTAESQDKDSVETPKKTKSTKSTKAKGKAPADVAECDVSINSLVEGLAQDDTHVVLTPLEGDSDSKPSKRKAASGAKAKGASAQIASDEVKGEAEPKAKAKATKSTKATKAAKAEVKEEGPAQAPNKVEEAMDKSNSTTKTSKARKAKATKADATEVEVVVPEAVKDEAKDAIKEEAKVATKPATRRCGGRCKAKAAEATPSTDDTVKDEPKKATKAKTTKAKVEAVTEESAKTEPKKATKTTKAKATKAKAAAEVAEAVAEEPTKDEPKKATKTTKAKATKAKAAELAAEAVADEPAKGEPKKAIKTTKAKATKAKAAEPAAEAVADEPAKDEPKKATKTTKAKATKTEEAGAEEAKVATKPATKRCGGRCKAKVAEEGAEAEPKKATKTKTTKAKAADKAEAEAVATKSAPKRRCCRKAKTEDTAK